MKQKTKVEEHLGTGRRKTAVASVRMRPGQGIVKVNDLPFDRYLPLEIQRNAVLAPFFKSSIEPSRYDLLIRVRGGGIEGQVIAMRLGLARALLRSDETVHADLKSNGFLTRDPRKRERKKYGLAGARKRFQFSKR